MTPEPAGYGGSHRQPNGKDRGAGADNHAAGGGRRCRRRQLSDEQMGQKQATKQGCGGIAGTDNQEGNQGSRRREQSVEGGPSSGRETRRVPYG